ncbi:MAG TPA: DUF349 domain-containing protein [Brumimicrobium sp.]|nr:DUF349 domain-containing protein [Brumimicrobium sp.]
MMMEKGEFIEALSALVENEDALRVSKDVNDLKTQFDDYLIEANRQMQVAQLEAEEKGEEIKEEEWILPLKEEFYTIYNAYNEKRKSLRQAKKIELEENLRVKRTLIARLKEVVEKEENIGSAFSAHKEINEEWKKIGDIPRDARHEIQQEYSRVLEEFFYNMNIYKEIKEYDFKKNYDAKLELIKRLKTFESVENIKEVEAGIKQIQNEWEDIGPTKQELWEEIKDEYWKTVNAIYERIRKHYDDLREKRIENLEKKKGLIKEIEEVLAKPRESVKEWNQHTKEIIKLQETWKTIGFGPKKENEQVWKVFRGLCDAFFQEKSEYFKVIDSEFDKVVEVKKDLIKKVNDLKGNQDWGPTTKTIIHLQNDWKKAGNAGQKNEQKLWKEFREACDFFFHEKNKFFAEKDKEFEENLKAKKKIIEEINEFTLPEDKKEAIETLKNFSKQFAEVGFVPAKIKDEVYKEYKEALFKHYDSLDMKNIEKEKVMFEARISTIKGSGNAEVLFSKEKQAIREEINTIKQEIMQLENNLGFFASSKGKNPFKEQVEKNIAIEQNKIEALKAKLKMIPNE